MMGPALDATDAATEEVSLSPTVYISKAGGLFAARNSATAISHDQDGYYRVNLNSTDTNTLGPLVLYFQDPAVHLPVVWEHTVVTANWWDSKYSTDELNVDVVQVAGSAVTGVNDFKATGFSTFSSTADTVVLAAQTHTGAIIPTVTTCTTAASLVSISTNALSQFMTVDTGETVASSGSVAQISQGSAGGSVSVGSLSTAALAQFATVDTGASTGVSGSVVALANGGVALTTAAVQQAAEDALTAQGYTTALATTLGTLSSQTGSGALAKVVTITDAVSNPIAGAQIWITTDVAGLNVHAGTLTTDSFGKVTFYGDAGTYYAWVDAPNYNESNPYTITVP